METPLRGTTDLIFGGFFAMGDFQVRRHECDRGLHRLGWLSRRAVARLACRFELVLALCLLTGAFFTEAPLLAAAYVLFLAIAFHGPARREGDRAVFRFFLHHITFIAGLLFAALPGPGTTRVIRLNLLGQR